MNVMVFDIETIPDIENGRRLFKLEHIHDDVEVANAMLSLQQAQTGHPFIKHHLQRVVAISIVFRQNQTLKIWSLGQESSSEADLISRFFAGLEKYKPTLVSWNGQQFDLPVLHYRALLHGVCSPLYWESGEQDVNFKYNNYLNRYHTRHCDLMDVLACFHQRSCARLDELAQLLGFPGKMGISGNDVLSYYFKGALNEIRNYCETDVINTYLIYLRFQLIKGTLSKFEHDAEITLLKNVLRESGLEHFNEYLRIWEKNERSI